MVKRRHPHAANNRLSLVFGADVQLRRGSDMDYMVMGGAGDDDDEQIDFALARPSPRNPGSAFCLDNIIMDQPPPQASNQSHLYCDVEGISPGPSPKLTTRPVIHPRQEDCQSSEI